MVDTFGSNGLATGAAMRIPVKYVTAITRGLVVSLAALESSAEPACDAR